MIMTHLRFLKNFEKTRIQNHIGHFIILFFRDLSMERYEKMAYRKYFLPLKGKDMAASLELYNF